MNTHKEHPKAPTAAQHSLTLQPSTPTLPSLLLIARMKYKFCTSPQLSRVIVPKLKLGGPFLVNTHMEHLKTPTTAQNSLTLQLSTPTSSSLLHIARMK